MLHLKNEFYRLDINESKGEIASFSYHEKNLLAEKQPPLFKVRFRTEKGEAISYDAYDMCICATLCEENKIMLTYTRQGETNIKVVLTVIGDDTPFTKWHAEVFSDLQLEWLEYPCVTVPDTFADRGGNSSILWPYNEGALVTNIDSREKNEEFEPKEPEYPSRGAYAMYPGMIFAPFMAVMTDNGGVYFAAHDTEPNTRNVDFFRTKDGIQLKLRLFPGIEGGYYKTTGETVLGVFEGDWYTAAEIYRNWFVGAKPSRLRRLSETSDLPEWYYDSPIVLTYCVRGHYDTDKMEPNKLFPYINGLDIVEKMAEQLQSRIMVVLMHWEGSAPWAPPYVWPPYGGEIALKEYADALHKQGHILGVYCSGFGWTQTSNIADYNKEDEFEQKNLKEVMCLSPEGELPLSNICNDQRYGYDLCPAHPFCYETMINEASFMASIGIDYAQLLDQNHGGTPYMCYAKNHGHPPVPGKWESEAAIRIMQGIHQSIGNKKMMFGCESSAAEVFIPELRFSDNRYEINFNFGMPVPLYAYIYHEYLHNFMGNQVAAEYALNCRLSKNNLLYRLAYSFVAGDLMTLVINDEGRIQWAWGQFNFSEHYMPDGEAVLRLVKNLNMWRKGAAYKYLNDGKMLRPLELDTKNTMELETKAGKMILSPLVTARYQAVDGSIGQIVVNTTLEDVSFALKETEELYISTSEKHNESVKALMSVAPLDAVLITNEKI